MMAKSPTQIIEEIRQQIFTNILAGPMPPPDEMFLLSQEYQDVWQVDSEAPVDAQLAAVLDEPGRQWFTKPRTPAEHSFDQGTEQLLRKKRWIESEQLASLAQIEKLLINDELYRQNVLQQNRKLSQQNRQVDLARLAELDRKHEKILSAARRNAIQYLGMVKTIEARKGYRSLLRKKERASRGGLGILGTLGMICAIHDFQKMADGIDKLAKKK